MPSDKAQTARFKLDVSNDKLKRMSEDIAKAPTYTVQLRRTSKGMHFSFSKQKDGTVEFLEEDTSGKPVTTDTTISTRSLSRKLHRTDADGIPNAENRYERQCLLGEGGVGRVYDMVDHNMGREVASRATIDAPRHKRYQRQRYLCHRNAEEPAIPRPSRAQT